MRTEEWIYGLNPVLEALKAGRTIKTVLVSEGRQEKVEEIRKEAEARGVSVEVAAQSFFDGRFPKGHQGVAARVLRKAYITLDELLMIPSKKNETPLFVILDGVEDPRNFGAILRSAEAAGVHGVVIQSHRSAGFGPEVAKSSAGAAEYVPVAMVPNIKHAMRDMRAGGITVIGAEAGNYPAAWDVDLSGPLSLVIGSEGRGARKTVRENCDGMVTIPVKGNVNSLNASVAAGILLFEILRQRTTKSKGF
ncbi:MAG: 23S rRNA (guanosine(2251)-2'-O)-methyltransferase RlmB [Nitrospirae bacterium]|nr:23S rRNA (guanosine(2251)-2'-O)-methyltransferase RlmB [Nitrospirota bacterium]